MSNYDNIPKPGNLLEPLPGFGGKENKRMIESMLEGGVFLRDIKVGGIIKIQTAHTLYTLTKEQEGSYLISGHPKYCPNPTKARIDGSTWGGSMIRIDFIGRNMHLEFHLEGEEKTILTSEIAEIWEEDPTQ
jgi:hypothetical protein